MDTTKVNFHIQLKTYINNLITSFDSISEERKVQLRRLGDYIRSRQTKGESIALNYICTHNSRRSHISQIWSYTAAAYYGINATENYSGGTEATAFNPRAVAAMERAGFSIQNPGGENPHYLVSAASEIAPLECFSKTFDDPFNPSANFAAIMTCAHADANCPFVPGAQFRLSLPYEDPKKADGLPTEAQVYDERVNQIGTEIFYAYSTI